MNKHTKERDEMLSIGEYGCPDRGNVGGYGWANPYFGVVEKSFVTKGFPPVSGVTDEPFPQEEFLNMFPEMRDVLKFPIEDLENAYKQSVYFVPNQNCEYLDGPDRAYARLLMAAHIAVLNKLNQQELAKPVGSPNIGMSTGIVSSSTVGGVSVSMQLPQSRTAWQYWLNQTKYGQKYQAFMDSKTPVGVYFAGDDIRGCFRD